MAERGQDGDFLVRDSESNVSITSKRLWEYCIHDFNIRRFGKQMAGFINWFLAILCFVTAWQLDVNVYFNPLSHFQTGDFSVSLKAPGRNKHFRVHVESGMYCIGQRKFVSLQQLVDHYQVRESRTKKWSSCYLFREHQFTHHRKGKSFSLSSPYQNNFWQHRIKIFILRNECVGWNECSWTQCSVKWQEIFDLNNQVNQANCNETRYSVKLMTSFWLTSYIEMLNLQKVIYIGLVIG